MERKKLTPEQIAALKRPLPADAVKPHPTKPYLSTIKVPYIVERLNEVFEIGGWFVENTVIEKKAHAAKNGDVDMVVVESVFTAPEYGIRVPMYGGNDNEDLGDAYKGACTDALSKIGSYLYIGMDVYKGHGNGNGSHTPAPSAPTPQPQTAAKPAQQPAKPVQSLAANHAVITVQKVEHQGNKFTVHSDPKVNNTKFLGCWQLGLYDAFAANVGKQVTVKFETRESNGKTYTNIAELVRAEVEPEEHNGHAPITDDDIPF